MAKFGKALASSILLISFGGSPFAEESVPVNPLLTARFVVDLGVYMPDNKKKITVDGTLGDDNDHIDFDEDLQGGNSEDVFAFDFYWRFGEKWSLRSQYFANSPSETFSLDEDIEWADITFGAGSNVEIGTEFSVLRLFFGRKFETGERSDFGVGAGLHLLEFGAFIAGEAIVNGMPAGFRREDVSVSAPLPNIGAWYMYSISPRWALSTRADWFAAGIDDYDGRLLNVSAGLNYNLFGHLGLGLSYNVLDLRLDVDKPSWHGSVSTRYSGVYASLSYHW